MRRVVLFGLAAKWLEAADDEDLLPVRALVLLASSDEFLDELLLLVCFIYFLESLDSLPLLLLRQLSLEPLLGLRIFVAVIESTEGIERLLGEAFLQGLGALFVGVRPFDVVLDAVVLLL